MKTQHTSGQLGSGARDWAQFQESHFRPFYEAILDRVGIRGDTQLLYVGCGPGGAAVLAAARGARVASLDFSAAAVELAAERVPNGDFRVGDMESLPWTDGFFDVVTGFNSFQLPAIE